MRKIGPQSILRVVSLTDLVVKVVANRTMVKMHALISVRLSLTPCSKHRKITSLGACVPAVPHLTKRSTTNVLLIPLTLNRGIICLILGVTPLGMVMVQQINIVMIANGMIIMN